MKDKLQLVPLLAAFALTVTFGWLALSPPANAQSTGQRAHSFVVATSTTKARVETDISGASKDYREIRCFNLTSTVIYLGDHENQEYPMCDGASCADKVLSVSTTNLYAKSASGTPNLTCITLR